MTTTLPHGGATHAAGEHTSLAIGGDGLGLTSYHDSTNSNLEVARLSRVPGLPSVRRR